MSLFHSSKHRDKKMHAFRCISFNCTSSKYRNGNASRNLLALQNINHKIDVEMKVIVRYMYQSICTFMCNIRYRVGFKIIHLHQKRRTTAGAPQNNWGTICYFGL